jgi:hypothetical protein
MNQLTYKELHDYFDGLLKQWLDGEISSTQFTLAIVARIETVNQQSNRVERWEPFNE